MSAPFWNLYPGDDDYPTGSFREPVEAPDVDPDDGDQLVVSYNPAWTKFLEGALMQLTEPTTWSGNTGEILLAQNRANLLQDLLQRPALYRVDSPYWEESTADDSDDSALNNVQTWYGLWNSGAGFVDSIAGFVFTGFVALNFGAESAITFATTLTRFRLAFRTRDTGAILRVLLDDDTFALVDTYSASPGEITLDVVSPGTTLIIQNTGTANDAATANDGLYSMEIIRKQLSEEEVSPTDIRYDETSDHFQRTVDGGATWVDAPGSDPRRDDAYRLPALSGTGHECDAAARIAAQWKETVDGFVAAINQYTFATSFIALIVEFVPGVGVLVDVALIVFDILAALTVEAITAAFTSDVWHGIQCAIERHIQPNGQLSSSDMDAVFSDIDSTYAGTVADTLHAIVLLYGEVLSSNAGVERTETGDCSDCDTCDQITDWQFYDSSYGTPVSPTSIVWLGGNLYEITDTTDDFGASYYWYLGRTGDACFTVTDIEYLTFLPELDGLAEGSCGTGNYVRWYAPFHYLKGNNCKARFRACAV